MSKKPDLFSLHRSLNDSLLQHADRCAISFRDSHTSCAQLLGKVQGVAAIIKKHNIRSIALLAENSADWIAIDLACLATGALCIPIPTFFSTQQVQHVLKASGAEAVIFASKEQQACAQFAACDLFPERIGELLLARLPLSSTGEMMQRLQNKGVAKITFTSGTTGAPKGVCLTQASIAAVCTGLHDALDEYFLGNHVSVLPYATLLENIAGSYLTLLRGGAVHIADTEQLGLSGRSQIANAGILGAIEQSEADTVILVPQQLRMLLDATARGWSAPQLRFIAVGGGRVPAPWLSEAHRAGLPVFEGYGLSECGSVVSLNTPRAHRDGTAGKALSHVQVISENGELRVSGEDFPFYLSDLESTRQETEQANITTVKTGDLGYVDKEGFVSVSGRKKNVLVSSFGRNISPEWPETELLASDLIAQCVVLGDAEPYCSALILPVSGVSDDQIEKLLEALNNKLPDYARILAWAALDEPLSIDNDLLTPNGRPKRAEISARFSTLLAAMYQSPLQADHGQASNLTFQTTNSGVQ